MVLITGDAVSSSSSTNSHDHDKNIGWSTTQPIEQDSCRSVLRTTEKSVVYRVRTQEKLSNSRGKHASNRSSSQKLSLIRAENRSGSEDANVHETLAELYAEMERKKMWLNKEEMTFQCGQQRLSSLQRDYAALLRDFERCKRRRKEGHRIQEMVRGPFAKSRDNDHESYSDSNSDSDYRDDKKHRHRSSSRRSRSRRDGARKERKRLRQFQSEVSLRFQLLESECQRSDLKIDKLVADLRREYADSCFFGNSLSFQ